jgi:hypothetical protein
MMLVFVDDNESANLAKDDIVPKPFHIPDLMVKTDRLISSQH